MAIRQIVFATVLFGLAAGCSDMGTPPPVNPPPIASIRITSTDTVLSPMESAQYQADIVDTTGALVLRVITWGVRDSAIATITSTGLLTGHTTGITWILATVDDVTDSLPLRLTRSFTAVSVGLYGACTIATDSAAYCWGNPSGTFPALPNGLPNLVDGEYRWTAIAGSGDRSCDDSAAAGRWCWGMDPLGDGVVHAGEVFTPVRVRDP